MQYQYRYNGGEGVLNPYKIAVSKLLLSLQTSGYWDSKPPDERKQVRVGDEEKQRKGKG